MATACICAIRSLAGLENPHSSMMQVATESGHPHWHLSRAPTRRTSTLGFWDAVWARVPTAKAAPNSPASTLLLNRRIFLRITHHFRAGVLHLDLAWTRQTNVPPISTSPPIQIHDTSGNT